MTPFDMVPRKDYEPDKSNDSITFLLVATSFEWTGPWLVNFAMDGQFFRRAIAGDEQALGACKELIWQNFLVMRKSALMSKGSAT